MQKHRVQKPPKKVFVATTIVIFFLTLSAADSIGLVPYYIDGTEPSSNSSSVALANLPELGEGPTAQISEPEFAAVPERIQSAAIDLDLPVQDSNTRDIPTLYGMLVNGPVRYVDSAKLGEEGNIILFGHSTSIPIVRNQMYKAFNRVSELKVGDTVSLEGGDRVFLYSVTSIRSVDVSEGVIDLSKEGRRLTLVTCDTLTGKTARFVVEAEFIGSY